MIEGCIFYYHCFGKGWVEDSSRKLCITVHSQKKGKVTGVARNVSNTYTLRNHHHHHRHCEWRLAILRFLFATSVAVADVAPRPSKRLFAIETLDIVCSHEFAPPAPAAAAAAGAICCSFRGQHPRVPQTKRHHVRFAAACSRPSTKQAEYSSGCV